MFLNDKTHKQMTQTYKILGMTCSSCEAKIKSELLSTPNVLSAEVSKDTGEAIVEMNYPIAFPIIENAVKKAGEKYGVFQLGKNPTQMEKVNISWLETYKPIILIFFYITLITSAVVFTYKLGLDDWMNFFMALFFIVFSFFKLLNLQGFADSYAMYDIIATRFKPYGLIYPFIELGLGLAFLANINPFVTNLITFIVMSISIVGVLQSVFNKRQIQCACLGAVFNLPMSTVTIIEDGLMILMSAYMLIKFL